MPGPVPRKPSGSSNAAATLRWMHEKASQGQHIGSAPGVKVYNHVGGQFVVASESRRMKKGGSVIALLLLYAEDNFLICREFTSTLLESGKLKIDSISSDNIYIGKPPGLRCSETKMPVWASGPAWDEATLSYARDSSEPYMVFTTAINWPDADTRPPAAGDGLNEWGEEAGDYGAGESRADLRLNHVRTVTVDGVSEDQRVIPVWRKGEIIYAQELEESEETHVGQIADAGETIEYIMLDDGRQWARI